MYEIKESGMVRYNEDVVLDSRVHPQMRLLLIVAAFLNRSFFIHHRKLIIAKFCYAIALNRWGYCDQKRPDYLLWTTKFLLSAIYDLFQERISWANIATIKNYKYNRVGLINGACKFLCVEHKVVWKLRRNLYIFWFFS